LGVELDVMDHEAVNAMVARVVAAWGRVDVLVANVGGGRGRPMDTKASTLDPAHLQLVVGMNLYGSVYSVNAVAPVMKEQRSGKIITVSSVAGTAPSADGGYAHYGAAKAAIAHYTRYLAQDLGPFGITANCIAPGVIATGRIMATVIPGTSRGNRDRSRVSRPAAARQRRGLRQGGRVPGDRPVGLCDGRGDPVDGGLVRREPTTPSSPAFRSNSNSDSGIELFEQTSPEPGARQRLPAPEKGGCLGYTLGDTLSLMDRIENRYNSKIF
jgi:3-oxoacyl-[acyl-carrier protein] reductase